MYPSGPHAPSSEARIVVPSYSFTWIYDRAACRKRLADEQDPAVVAVLERLDSEFSSLTRQLECITTPHTVGGRGYTHSIPHYGRVLREGLEAYQERIEHHLRIAERTHDEARIDFYASLLDVLEGIRVWRAHLVARLEAQPREETEAEARRRHLLRALSRVPFQPARTFVEAVVAYNLIFYLDDCDNPGRVDQELISYYRRDLAEGLIRYEDAEAYLHELWCNTDSNNGWSATIGGSTPNGEAAYNELTAICLRAARGMRRPNLQLRIRRDMPDEIWDEALETLGTGTGIPALHNEEEFLRSIREAHLGVRTADLSRINGGGCTETMIHGCSNVGSLDAGINLPLVLVQTLRECLAEAASFAEVLQAYKDDVRRTVRTMVDQVNLDQQTKARLRPHPMRSLLVDDCIDNGLDFHAGGARYNWSVVNVAGLANVIDSLAAVRRVVFETGEMDGTTLLSALEADFEGFEPLRQRLEKAPRFGNDIREVDELAREISTFVLREFLIHAPWRGGKFLASCLMFVTYAAAGVPVGATPDGRRAGTPLADSAGPVQGRDRNGPTALIKSLAAIPHYLAPGTLVVNTRFSRDLFADRAGRATIRSLVETYFRLGGMQLQVNVVDQDLLRQACENPEAFPDLVVRIGGYSEYFVRLSPELRRTVLQRTEHHCRARPG